MPAAAPYSPRTLAAPRMPGLGALVEDAKAGRLVLYLGAGVSAAPPSNGPLGAQVADRLRHEAATILECDVSNIEKATLEVLATKIGELGADHLDRLKSLAAEAFDFAAFAPNYAHRAVALLMREGLIKAITVNWDCAVEHAGVQIGASIAGVTTVVEARSLAGQIPLFKVHGSATRPTSLKISREEVDAPQQWAIAEVQSALTSGTVVFVGLATVGDYVSDPIASLLTEWSGYASAIRVVAPSIPPAWNRLLGDHADAALFASYAEEFFDNLLCEILSESLTRLAARAQLLGERDAWAKPMADGAELLRNGLAGVPAHLILSWWRDGVTPSLAGRPFVTDLAGQNALMAVAHRAGATGELVAGGAGARFHVRTSEEYIEILARPGKHLSDIQPIAIDHAHRRWENGAYEDGRPVTYVVVGADGRFPATDAVADIAAGDDETGDIGVGIVGSIRFIAAEDAVQGRLS